METQLAASRPSQLVWRSVRWPISSRSRICLLLLVTIVVAGVYFFLPRIPQPQSYHQFADGRSLFGIPHFGDVVSNLPFAVIGLWGLIFLLQSDSARIQACFVDRRERWPYLFVFAGLLLTAAGSSYYHLAPDNAHLVWDRLPMTAVFMSMVAAVIAERISVPLGLRLLPILLILGAVSVVQWYASELKGQGDLRLYAAVQVYSGLILLVGLLFPSRYTRASDFAVVVAFYVLAKALETIDRPVFRLTHFVSGHTLKHLAGATAGYWILHMLQMRRPVAYMDVNGKSKPIGASV